MGLLKRCSQSGLSMTLYHGELAGSVAGVAWRSLIVLLRPRAASIFVILVSSCAYVWVKHMEQAEKASTKPVSARDEENSHIPLTRSKEEEV